MVNYSPLSSGLNKAYEALGTALVSEDLVATAAVAKAAVKRGKE